MLASSPNTPNTPNTPQHLADNLELDSLELGVSKALGSNDSDYCVHKIAEREVVDIWMQASGAGESLEQEAARKIQLAALPRLIANKTSLCRTSLLDRLELEVDLQRGLRLLLLCLALFCVVIYLNILESQSDIQLGLLNTYQKLFQLDDSLADITTASELKEFLQMVSKQSRQLMPISSEYFVEDEGEIKVFQGLQAFLTPIFVEVPSLKPRVDSLAFSIMAWVQLEPGTGANILRKPLGKSPSEKLLSCWGWYVGMPSPRFSFGAHDFRGGTGVTSQEEVITGETDGAADGQLHSVAVVVTQTNVSFWLDAKLQSTHDIVRPVTDCSGLSLQIGEWMLIRPYSRQAVTYVEGCGYQCV